MQPREYYLPVPFLQAVYYKSVSSSLLNNSQQHRCVIQQECSESSQLLLDDKSLWGLVNVNWLHCNEMKNDIAQRNSSSSFSFDCLLVDEIISSETFKPSLNTKIAFGITCLGATIGAMRWKVIRYYLIYKVWVGELFKIVFKLNLLFLSRIPFILWSFRNYLLDIYCMADIVLRASATKVMERLAFA